jgi:GNAT superfamily N-acetyltransferase
MTSLLVRRALPEDLEEILAMQAEDSMHYYTEPSEITANQRAAFDEIDADVNQDLLVGELDGQIVCTAQVTWIRVLSADGGLYCQVEAVRTSSAMRGQGIGRILMESIEAEARHRGAARIQLTTNKERTRAHKFYEELGFVASHIGMKKYL